jgi:hypothetical protein
MGAEYSEERFQNLLHNKPIPFMKHKEETNKELK